MRPSRVVAAALALALVPLAAPAMGAEPRTSPEPEVLLVWHDCPADLASWECATLTVPRNWFQPSALTAKIELAVKRARKESVGPLTFNPGGPGGSGLQAATRVYGTLPPRIKDSFDFVAWDPRGVGASMPQLTGCGLTAPRPRSVFPPTGSVDWLAFTRSWAATTSPQLQACWEANPGVAPYLGTDYVVRDLEAMREQLGYEKWSILGLSYGSRIGFRYARAYPDRVRALVLDGAWDPNASISEWAAADTWAFTYAQSVFSSLFGKRMAARFARVLRALNNRTVVIDGRVRTRWDLTLMMLGDISQQAAYPDIVAVIDTVYDAMFRSTTRSQERRASEALARLEVLAQDQRSSEYTLNMVMCADMVGRPSLEETAKFAETAYLNSSVLASLVAVTKGITCEGLPAEIAPPYPPLEEELTLPTPPVVINALGDSRTPWLGARTLANYLTGSAFITYNGTQHVVYRRVPSTCVNAPVTEYILSLSVPSSITCDYAPLRTQ